MKKSSLVLAATMCVLLSSCSNQAELDAANKRITELESQLASVKEKNLAITSTTVALTTTTTIAEVAASTTSTGLQWNYSANEDKMTGGTTYFARVSSTNSVNFGSPYGGPQNGQLTLRTDPKYGKDVIFAIERGQVLCRSYEDCTILVRFDDEKPTNYAGVGAADGSSELVFLRNYDRFVAKLQKAKTVRLSAPIYQEGNPVFEFDVSGFSAEKYKPKK